MIRRRLRSITFHNLAELLGNGRSALCHGRARSLGQPGAPMVTYATGAEARPGHDPRSVVGGHRDPTYKADVRASEGARSSVSAPSAYDETAFTAVPHVPQRIRVVWVDGSLASMRHIRGRLRRHPCGGRLSDWRAGVLAGRPRSRGGARAVGNVEGVGAGQGVRQTGATPEPSKGCRPSSWR